MSEDSCFIPSETHYAAIDINTDQGNLPIYFSFKVVKVRDNQIEIDRISPPGVENFLLSQKNANFLLKRGKNVYICKFSDIRQFQGILKADFSYQGTDKRSYFRLNIHRSRKNKFVLNKKAQLISSVVQIKDISLDPPSYRLITGIGLVVPDYVEHTVSAGDILSVTGNKLKIKFEVRWIKKNEIGGRVLSADRDSYKILSALYHDTVDSFLKKFR
ncbi:hypothetical protein [Persephonella sp.]